MGTFASVIFKILEIVLMLLIVAAAVGIFLLIYKLIKKIYCVVYRIVAYVTTPGKMLVEWLWNKIPFVEKFSHQFQNSRWGKIVTIVVVCALFVVSLGFLLLTAWGSGDIMGYLGNDFLMVMPSLSIITLFIGDSFGDSLAQVMAETTVISLSLFYINRKIDNSNILVKIIYNIAFIVIGWAIGQFVAPNIFLPMIEFLPECFALFDGAMWDQLIGVPVLARIVQVHVCILDVVVIFAIIYILVSALLLAFRELTAPLSFSVLFFLLFAFFAFVFQNFTDSVVYIILFFASFVIYEIWRVVCLGMEEADIDEDVEDKLEDCADNIKDFFRKRFRKKVK